MFFNKKNQVIGEEQYQEKTKLVYKTLQGLCNGGIVYNEGYSYEHALGRIIVKAKIISYDEGIIQIEFVMNHRLLNKPIKELISAVDKSFSDSIITASKSFFDRILSLYLLALQNTSSHKIKVSLKQDHIYHSFVGEVFKVGNKNSGIDNYFPYIKQYLGKYLGNYRTCMVKVMVLSLKGKLKAKVYINQKESISLAALMLKQLDVQVSKHDWVEKQYFFFTQEAWTYQEYPHSKEKINTLVIKTITLLEKCFHQYDIDTVYDIMVRTIIDRSLACELVYLIPEIVAKYYYDDIKFNDLLYMNNTDNEWELGCSCLHSYYLIEKYVYHYLQTTKLSEDKITNILRYSSSANLIRKLKKEGKNKIVIKAMSFKVVDGYQPR